VKGGRSRTLLAVKDDGVGLPNEVSQSTGMGLRTMNYRAAALGGQLDLRRQPEGGTLIICSVPTQPLGGETTASRR